MGGYGLMSFHPKMKNPLILSVTATLFLVPVLMVTMVIFLEGIRWAMLAVTSLIYFFLIFLIFFYYGSRGKR
jgi:hypothetical protein